MCYMKSGTNSTMLLREHVCEPTSYAEVLGLNEKNVILLLRRQRSRDLA